MQNPDASVEETPSPDQDGPQENEMQRLIKRSRQTLDRVDVILGRPRSSPDNDNRNGT